jgi:hypothetical protein
MPLRHPGILRAGGFRLNWTSDGRSVVLTSVISDVKGEERWLCEVTTGAVTKLALAPERVTDIAMAPGGSEIAYVGGPASKDEGVWMLENFLPPAKKPAPKIPQPSKR